MAYLGQMVSTKLCELLPLYSTDNVSVRKLKPPEKAAVLFKMLCHSNAFFVNLKLALFDFRAVAGVCIPVAPSRELSFAVGTLRGLALSIRRMNRGHVHCGVWDGSGELGGWVVDKIRGAE